MDETLDLFLGMSRQGKDDLLKSLSPAEHDELKKALGARTIETGALSGEGNTRSTGIMDAAARAAGAVTGAAGQANDFVDWLAAPTPSNRIQPEDSWGTTLQKGAANVPGMLLAGAKGIPEMAWEGSKLPVQAIARGVDTAAGSDVTGAEPLDYGKALGTVAGLGSMMAAGPAGRALAARGMPWLGAAAKATLMGAPMIGPGAYQAADEAAKTGDMFPVKKFVGEELGKAGGAILGGEALGKAFGERSTSGPVQLGSYKSGYSHSGRVPRTVGEQAYDPQRGPVRIPDAVLDPEQLAQSTIPQQGQLPAPPVYPQLPPASDMIEGGSDPYLFSRETGGYAYPETDGGPLTRPRVETFPIHPERAGRQPNWVPPLKPAPGDTVPISQAAPHLEDPSHPSFGLESAATGPHPDLLGAKELPGIRFVPDDAAQRGLEGAAGEPAATPQLLGGQELPRASAANQIPSSEALTHEETPSPNVPPGREAPGSEGRESPEALEQLERVLRQQFSLQPEPAQAPQELQQLEAGARQPRPRKATPLSPDVPPSSRKSRSKKP